MLAAAGGGRQGGWVAAFAAFPHSSASFPSSQGVQWGCGSGMQEHSEFCIPGGHGVGVVGTVRGLTLGVLWLIPLLCPRFWGRHWVVLIFLGVRAASFAWSCSNRAIEDF